MTKVAVRLAGGELRVEVRRSDLPLAALCGFASRRNPKRPFLFVSRVLGRHLPVRPQTMHMVHRRLASKLRTDFPGPAVVIGMAETAVALGHGVHEAWRRMSGREDVVFIHSTRYRLASRRLFLRFEESHSHATGHLVHEPADPTDAALLAACRTLVLVDDEVSTGSTFTALAKACRTHMPGLSRILCVTITDWMGEERGRNVQRAMPVRTDFVSLLEGNYSFLPSDAPPPRMPDLTGDGRCKDALVPINWGRLGVRGPRPLLAHVMAIGTKPGERILVLGTGEFVFPPFQLAQRLSAMGAEVMVQATTRSPILEGNDIHGVLEFPDAYADGIPNFLYSVRPGQYDRVLVCYETPPATCQHGLISALGAEPVFFNAAVP
ncbi:MAG: phosphoribosyltransferase family protein [Alphaproteobacteria bacterium]|nr:phosphoribosyltransferase family protein [Alphaproteobacteria bacterium]MBF0391255.1 phosphoribosyltransferase family protein [Alphaproteobacteria bacterium]